MQEQGDRAADDVALSSFIDDELAEEDAERVRARLATDTWLAHRFVAMIQATAAIRLAYRDAMEVLGVVAAVSARAVGEELYGASDRPAAPAPTGGPHAPVRKVDLAVASLTTDQRIALCLAVLENLSYPEIAVALRVPHSAVMARLAEARAALAASFGESLLATVPAASTLRH